jgi:hypothetical protein
MEVWAVVWLSGRALASIHEILGSISSIQKKKSRSFVIFASNPVFLPQINYY